MGQLRRQSDRLADQRNALSGRGRSIADPRLVVGQKLGPRWESFLAILGRIERGRNLGDDQVAQLIELLVVLLEGGDVRRWFRVPRVGRPIAGVHGLYFEIADYVRFDFELRRTGKRGETKRLIGEVADAWQLNERQVKRMIGAS